MAEMKNGNVLFIGGPWDGKRVERPEGDDRGYIIAKMIRPEVLAIQPLDAEIPYSVEIQIVVYQRFWFEPDPEVEIFAPEDYTPKQIFASLIESYISRSDHSEK